MSGSAQTVPEPGPAPLRPMRPLDGRLALVTGADAAVGRASALALAEAGADVLLPLAVDASARSAELVERIERLGGEAIVVALDLDDLEGTIDAIERASGERAVDVFVHALGARVEGDALVLERRDLDRVFGPNLVAPYLLSQHVAARLLARGQSGAIVFVGSEAAHAAIARESLGSMTGAALVQLARCLALEWARYGIRVNAVSPCTVADDACRRGDRHRRPRRRERRRRGAVPRLPRGGRRQRSRPRSRGRGDPCGLRASNAIRFPDPCLSPPRSGSRPRSLRRR